MKNLFLAAKHYAYIDDRKIVTMKDVLKASNALFFSNKDLYKYLSKYDFDEIIEDDIDDFFSFESNYHSKYIGTGEFLDEIYFKIKDYKLKFTRYSDDVKALIKKLENDGFSLENEKYVFLEKKIDIIAQVKEVKKYLNNNIYGQDNAIEAVVDSFKDNIHQNKSAPKHTFFFLGVPGTGKTYMGQLLSECLEGYNSFKQFDMSQYQNDSDGIQLFGVARGFGTAKVGELTSFVRKNPKSIIVLDEFEKANIIIQNSLLSIFSGGYLKDACGWCNGEPYSKENNNTCDEEDIENKVDFTKTVVIITSNLGSEIYNDRRFSDILKEDSYQAENIILESIKNEKKDINGTMSSAISAPMISRLSQASIVFFNKLKFKDILDISKTTFNSYIKSFEKQYSIKHILENDYNDIIKILTLTFSPNLDIRRIKSKLGKLIFNHITDWLISEDVDIKHYKELKIRFSKDVGNTLVKINKLINEDKIDREIVIKNELLKYEYLITINKKTLIFEFTNIYFEKVKRVADFNGEVPLTFELPDKSFDNIAGHEKAKKRLEEVINLLKNRDKLKEFDIKIPKGVLLYGPPGTGKTMLAKALANEAKLPFISTTANDLISTEGLISKVFAKANENAPTIIFIDELDAFRKRGTSAQNESYFAPKINAFLTNLDGFDSSNDVFVIAATNKKEDIDEAILRSGRIDVHIQINSLDKEARKFFIENIILKDSKAKVDIEKLVKYTTTLNGSDLQKVKREAFLYAIRHGLDDVTEEILIEQINTIKYGDKITHLSVDETLEETAYHEAGHAIISRVVRPEKKIEQITITPRDRSLGFVSYEKSEEYSNTTIDDIKNHICICLAGRLTQVKRYSNIKGLDTGASDDLEKATMAAYQAIAIFGMDEEFGNLNISKVENLQQDYDGQIKRRVQVWIKECEEKTIKLIENHWDEIDALAQRLLKEEVVDGEYSKRKI